MTYSQDLTIVSPPLPSSIEHGQRRMAQTTYTRSRQAATAQERPPPPPTRRSLLSRFTLAHGLMVLSGLLAFVLVAAGLGDRGEVVKVAVARADIPGGTLVTAELVTSSELPADSPLAKTVATLDGLRGTRWTTTQPVPAGNPIRRSELVEGEQPNTLRSMSIPVTREHAVGGALAVGDRVDVIDVVEGRAAFVVTGAQVTKVATPGSAGGIAGDASRQFFVVVQVGAQQALAITEALADGKVDLVRSTGAPPVRGAAVTSPGAGG